MPVRRSIDPEQRRTTIEPHKTATGGLEQVVLDASGRLILIINEPITLEKLQLTHPHLTDMAKAALWWGLDP